MNVIRYTIFDSIAYGNGAEKRTAQVTEILNTAAISSIFVKKNFSNQKVSYFYLLIKTIPVIKDLQKIINIFEFRNLKDLFRTIKNYLLTEKLLLPALSTDAKVLIWECTRSNNYFVPLICRKYHKKVIAIPHNLESLVPTQISSVSYREAPFWLNEEIKYLSLCEGIFCISKEETLFLQLFNLNAHYFPYFPTKQVEMYFRNIGENRRPDLKKTSNKNILMLGSANNPPTRLGMIESIRYFINLKDQNITLRIGGFKSETLIEEVESSLENIEIAGELSTQELENELLNTDAVLIHQRASTGALTRIPEMLLARIPIIANFESARNYYNLEGMYIYQDETQLKNILQLNKYENFSQITRPLDEEALFIREVNKFI